MRTSDSKDLPRFFHLMRRQFTPREWEAIRVGEEEEQQLRTFYRHWCLKESFVKADGGGLGWNLQRLNFVVSRGGLNVIAPRPGD